MRRWVSSACGAALLGTTGAAAPQDEASDGAYGRLEGDLVVSGEVGVTETVGNASVRGESLALRFSTLYLSTVGFFGQYNESFDIPSQPVARSVVGGVELRPLFLGRWTQDTEHGPPQLDLWLDSISLTLGLHNLWRHPEHCGATAIVPGPPHRCHAFGMEFSVGMELPLLPQASAPFIALRGAVRWSLEDLETVRPAPPPMGLITLTLGYHHLFEAHLVDAADRSPR